MLELALTLWFLTSLGVVAYGASNSANVVLGLPRWTSVGIVVAGCCMLLAMFTAMFVAAGTNVPGDWGSTNFGSGDTGGGGGD